MIKYRKNVILIGSADWEKLRDIIEKSIGIEYHETFENDRSIPKKTARTK